jgi:hypothetical protein
MDWILVAAFVGSVIWLAMQVLDDRPPGGDRCVRCGGEMAFTADGLELLRHEVATSVPARCAACGAPGIVATDTFGTGGGDSWQG